MSSLYECGCDDCRKINLSANSDDKDFKSVLNAAENAFKHLHEKGGYKSDDINEKLYQNLINETQKVFDSALSDNVIPPAMLAKLQNDTFIFSGLKTHAQLLEASSFLRDEKGQVRSFDAFANDFNKVNQKYNQNYLQAEHQFAVNSSQMAANWAATDPNGRYNLQYRTANDDRVRENHRALQDITLPKEDSFWLSYYPPNGWRCRCTAVEVRKSKFPESDSETASKNGERATSQIGKDGKNKLEIFRFNPGAEQKVFPPKHPYNKVKDAEKVKMEIGKEMYPVPTWTTSKKYPNGGKIVVHQDTNKKSTDYKDVRKCCDFFAKDGAKTQILPKYDATQKNKDYESAYSDLKDTKYWGKCPDLKIGDKYYELEGYEGEGKNKYSKMLTRGLKQSENVILEKSEETTNHLKKIIHFRIKEGQQINEVWVKNGDQLELVYKRQESNK